MTKRRLMRAMLAYRQILGVQLRQRVRSLTDGVIIGSREFVDGWFERNRSWFGGASKTERKTGARTIAKGWRGLYNLRELK